MIYLFDTNVLSELFREEPDANVSQFAQAVRGDDVAISVVSFAEISFGVSRLPDGKKRHALELGFRDLLAENRHRALACDIETALIWAHLRSEQERRGRTIRPQDAWIASTAVQHGLSVVTRNVRDFDIPNLRVINPWLSTA